jgi:hypothetical protein
MTVKEKEAQSKQVESAIRGLFTRFPHKSDSRHSCADVDTKEIRAVKAKIKARETALSKDAELKKLRDELKQKRCDVMNAGNAQHDRVCVLLRKFQTRGVTEKLLDEIDRLSVEKPVIVEACSCSEGDN